MNDCIITPWPFKNDETATLFWINSPYTAKNGAKMVRIYLNTDSTMVPFDLPWGCLPLLKIGYRYLNGRIFDEGVGLSTGSFSLKNINKPKIKNAYDSIYKRFYSFNNASPCGFEKCISFYVGNNRFIIPCIELVRAVFANKSFYANRLISSAGLNELTTSEQIGNNHIHIDFSSDFPRELLKDQFIEEYIWLKYTPEIYSCWESVYSNLVVTKHIEVQMPSLLGAVIKYKGLSYRNQTLILNIQLRNLRFPFESYSYSHPYRTETSGPATSERVKYLGPNGSDNLPLDSRAITTKKNGTLLIFDDEVSKHFINPPKLIKTPQLSHEGFKAKKIYIEKQMPIFSMQDNTGDGRALPVDLLSPNNVQPVASDSDFIEFCSALNQIKKTSGVMSLDVLYISIPGDSKFSIMVDGRRRRLAVAKALLSHGQTLSIIEACNMDGWELSTLTILSNEDGKMIVNQILEKLIVANGHWSKSWFIDSSAVRFKPIKHYDRDPIHWAELMLKISPLYIH